MPDATKKICYDRILPRDLRLPRPADLHDRRLEAALVFAKRWPVGSTLSVRFIEGTDAQKATVRQFAAGWTQHANLKLDFNDALDAEIRIAFQDDGAWSYIGTDCADIPRDQPTMNYGWLDEGVVLHEFGHAIGLIHEHQNPQGAIQWNKPVVYRDLAGPPNFWDPATVDHNLFATYAQDQINGTAVDSTSIMMYSIPAAWTLDGFSAGSNDVLSNTDKQFIASDMGYPGLGAPASGPVAIPVNGSAVEAELKDPGEEDLFTFSAASGGFYTVETSGQTDVLISLYGPDSQTSLIAHDDDSGPGLNSRISRNLGAGSYFVQVRHYNTEAGTGTYAIKVAG